MKSEDRAELKERAVRALESLKEELTAEARLISQFEKADERRLMKESRLLVSGRLEGRNAEERAAALAVAARDHRVAAKSLRTLLRQQELYSEIARRRLDVVLALLSGEEENG